MRQSVTEDFSVTKVDKASYKMNQKKWLYYFFILLFSLDSLAEETTFEKKDFFIKLSVDNNPILSQDAVTNLALSSISWLAYLDSPELCNSLLCRVAYFNGVYLVIILNHEISGHASRILEFDGTVEDIKVGLSGGYIGYNPATLKPQHLQTHAIVALGGTQADYLLSQKLSDNFVFHKQKIDPITGAGYFASATDQLHYNYLSNHSDGHDLKGYVKMMEAMYGDKSMSLDTLKYHGFLSFLDPILFASIYSMFTDENIDVPALSINNIGIIPFARSIFTPYGVIEKKFGSYILTDYTPIKVGFSIGQQFKTSKINTDFKYSIFSGPKEGEAFNFTGLKEGEAIEQHMTYSFDISVFKLFSFEKLNIGAVAAFWRQPELFVKDPYREKPKNGFMFIINSSYEASKDFNILFNIGYKSKGFIPGQRIDKTFMVSLALEYRI